MYVIVVCCLLVVMATAMSARSTSGVEAEMKRLLARYEDIQTRSDCPVSWQKLSSTRSLGGSKMPNTDSVAKCLHRCSVEGDCLGVDVDLNKEPLIECWKHIREYDFGKHRTYRAYGFNQYIKEKGC